MPLRSVVKTVEQRGQRASIESSGVALEPRQRLLPVGRSNRGARVQHAGGAARGQPGGGLLVRGFLVHEVAGSQVHDVQEDPRFQHRGVDLLWERSDDDVLGVEVKGDRQGGRRGTYFLELVSNWRRTPRGAFSTARADLLAYVFLDRRELHLLPVPAGAGAGSWPGRGVPAAPHPDPDRHPALHDGGRQRPAGGRARGGRGGGCIHPCSPAGIGSVRGRPGDPA